MTKKRLSKESKAALRLLSKHMPFYQIQREKRELEYPICISNFQAPISTLTKEKKLKGQIYEHSHQSFKNF